MISRVKPHRWSFLYFVVLFCLVGCSSFRLRAQTTTPAADSILPGPKPADVKPGSRQLIGIYSRKSSSIIILERDEQLIYRDATGSESRLHQNGPFLEATRRDSRKVTIALPMEYGSGPIHELGIDQQTYVRADGEGDSAHFSHVNPARPVTELREEALKMTPPTEAGPFRDVDLVDLAALDTAIHLDIRYAHHDNFLSTPVYTQARALLQRPAAEALTRVLHKLRPLGYGLLIHDAYRPWYVTKIFWDATPPEGKIFVANPQKGSKHNRGCAVDLTLYDLQTGKPVEMPGLYDEMSPRSFPNFPGGTSLQRWHRDLLRRAMESEGYTVNEDEWWHFDYKDWKAYPILNLPFEKIAVSQ